MFVPMVRTARNPGTKPLNLQSLTLPFSVELCVDAFGLPREHANVLDDAPPERGHVVAALERGDHAPLGVALRDVHQLFRDPAIVLVLELEVGERVLAVRV